MRKLIEGIIRISNAASTDSIRCTMNGVALDMQGDSIRLRATDSRIFTEELFPLSTLNEAPKELKECIVPIDAIKKLRLLLKSAGRYGTAFRMQQIVEPKCTRLLFTYGAHERPIDTCEVICPDVEFPKTDHLKVNTDDRPYHVALNPELLLKLYKALKDTRNERVVLMLPEKPGTLQSIVVEYGFNSGLIMPCRI